MASATWFKNATIYQIYPRSFRDSNGDGIGDLRGIIEKLDYLKNLGVDAVWLCPIYASPNDDNGYDISDYQAIHPDFGTMADFDELLAGLHQRGIRLIMDMVLNHSSDEHPWFVSSRSGEDSPHRNWYHWQAPQPDGSPPNQWGSFFNGSAWEQDSTTGEYYLHLFSKKQPDLNWENPELRQACYAMMRWWLEKGVDGFRLDVVNLISKKPGYPEGPAIPGSPYTQALGQVANGPRIHEFLQEMNREVFAPYGAVTVGETPAVTPEEGRLYTDPSRRELNMIFQFEMMDVDSGPLGKFDLAPCEPDALVKVCRRWQEGLGETGWNSLYWNNHDQPRVVSRFGDEGPLRELSGMALAAFLYLQKGTAFVYQGEEIGMTNLPWQNPDELRDLESRNFLKETSLSPEWTSEKIWKGILAKGRDNARSPFCWTSEAGAGFTKGVPWLRIHPANDRINAEESRARSNSLWSFYRRLIQLRRENRLISDGTIEFLSTPHPELALYVRRASEDKLWVMVNLSGDKLTLPTNGPWKESGQTTPILANYATMARPEAVRPWEVRVWSCSS